MTSARCNILYNSRILYLVPCAWLFFWWSGGGGHCSENFYSNAIVDIVGSTRYRDGAGGSSTVLLVTDRQRRFGRSRAGGMHPRLCRSGAGGRRGIPPPQTGTRTTTHHHALPCVATQHHRYIISHTATLDWSRICQDLLSQGFRRAHVLRHKRQALTATSSNDPFKPSF